MNDALDAIGEAIRKIDSFLVTCHINPEGDAIGSEIAFALALRKIGKKVTVVNQDPLPYSLEFLPGAEEIFYEDQGDDFGGAVILDCGTPERTGWVREIIARCPRVICIDHHSTSGGFGDFVYCDPHASSTGELVYRLLKRMEIPIDADIATALWVAISTDTGSFRYTNVAESTLLVAAELVKAGAEPGEISEHLYEMEPKGRIKLLSKALASLEVINGGRIASIAIYRKDVEDFGGRFDYLEGFINFPRSIRGVLVAVSFREEGNGTYKVSLRSKKNVDVAQVPGFSGEAGM